jgi:hypothetical protein
MPFLNDIRNKAKRAPHPPQYCHAHPPKLALLRRVSVRIGEGFHKIIEYADCFGKVV